MDNAASSSGVTHMYHTHSSKMWYLGIAAACMTIAAGCGPENRQISGARTARLSERQYLSVFYASDVPVVLIVSSVPGSDVTTSTSGSKITVSTNAPSEATVSAAAADVTVIKISDDGKVHVVDPSRYDQEQLVQLLNEFRTRDDEAHGWMDYLHQIVDAVQ